MVMAVRGEWRKGCKRVVSLVMVMAVVSIPTAVTEGCSGCCRGLVKTVIERILWLETWEL